MMLTVADIVKLLIEAHIGKKDINLNKYVCLIEWYRCWGFCLPILAMELVYSLASNS